MMMVLERTTLSLRLSAASSRAQYSDASRIYLVK
jgi:hypothetical protein